VNGEPERAQRQRRHDGAITAAATQGSSLTQSALGMGPMGDQHVGEVAQVGTTAQRSRSVSNTPRRAAHTAQRVLVA
jgi:hypothetical protein